MIAAISVASFAGGTVVSCLADRLSIPRSHAETLGGILLIAALVVVGAGLGPAFR